MWLKYSRKMLWILRGKRFTFGWKVWDTKEDFWEGILFHVGLENMVRNYSRRHVMPDWRNSMNIVKLLKALF